MGMVEGSTKKEKKWTAITSCLTAFIIVGTFAIFGKNIFEIFHIGIPGFKVAGGLLLFYIGFEMELSGIRESRCGMPVWMSTPLRLHNF